MKILSVGQFDPCCFHLRHKKYLTELGIDLRLAVERVYWDAGNGADYILGRADDEAQCLEFAKQADIIQFSPVIDQEWSYQTTDPVLHGDIDERPFGDIVWSQMPGLRVACFHGSVNALPNAELYARHFRSKAMAIAATSLNYVGAMNATYLPPIVDVAGQASRRKNEILKLIHSPTNRDACGTTAFLDAVKRIPVRVTVSTGKTHAETVRAKTLQHAGYDHMRGDFSINSLENAALGLANIVAVTPQNRRLLKKLHGVTLPWPEIETLSDAAEAVNMLATNRVKTIEYQTKALSWFRDEWEPRKVAARVAAAYRKLAS